MSDIRLGTLYDMNKAAILQEQPLTKTELKQKMKEIKGTLALHKDRYFILLNRETYNFTLLDFGKKDVLTIERVISDLEVALHNRGKIISIDFVPEQTSFEIWITANKDAFIYYLFPYDIGVIN